MGPATPPSCSARCPGCWHPAHPHPAILMSFRARGQKVRLRPAPVGAIREKEKGRPFALPAGSVAAHDLLNMDEIIKDFNLLGDGAPSLMRHSLHALGRLDALASLAGMAADDLGPMFSRKEAPKRIARTRHPRVPSGNRDDANPRSEVDPTEAEDDERSKRRGGACDCRQPTRIPHAAASAGAQDDPSVCLGG